ncbi:MAG: MATE family efflux transporter [Pseudoflavonifractor sp.]
MGKDPIPTLLFRLAVPAITAQLVNALYNIVDRMYIGHMGAGGDLAITGLGVAFPVLMFISALSALVGMGGGSRAAIRIGEGNMDRANEILGNCTLMLVIISVLVTAVFLPLQRPMLLLFGATENTIGYATQYLTIYLCGTIFVQLALGLNNFITTQGFSTISMMTVIIGAVTNIVLDPIFIFGFDMGVRGAALATVIAQAVSAIWVVCFLMGKKTKLRIQKRYLRLNPKVLLPVVAIGVSPFIMQSTESLVSIALNSSLKMYGGDAYVGAMTIGGSIMQVLTMPFMGMAQGAQPIIGFNYGAGKLDRVKQTFKLLLISSVFLSTLGWALVQLFPGAFISIFNDKKELVDIAMWAIRVYMGCMFMMGIQFACQNTFVALGQAKISLFLALLRKIILLIPLIYILPLIFTGNQVFAVYLAEPVADVLAATATGLIFMWKFPRILKGREAALAE